MRNAANTKIFDLFLKIILGIRWEKDLKGECFGERKRGKLGKKEKKETAERRSERER
jgi:hypothetical protein